MGKRDVRGDLNGFQMQVVVWVTVSQGGEGGEKQSMVSRKINNSVKNKQQRRPPALKGNKFRGGSRTRREEVETSEKIHLEEEDRSAVPNTERMKVD